MSGGAEKFRAELIKIMPGYSWTVHRPSKFRDIDALHPEPLIATGIQSSGFNRLSTLQVTRRERDGVASYTATSSGYGTLARALRGLQDHYQAVAATYRSHAASLEAGRGKEKRL